MRKLIRLIVACTIRNNDDYYRNALKSLGVNTDELSHQEISLWKAYCKMVEVDILIETAFNLKNRISLDDAQHDLSEKLKKAKTSKINNDD